VATRLPAEAAAMRVLVACERSGVVRRAFRGQEHDAWSCDLVSADDGSPHHIIGDAVATAYAQHWDLLLAFPPCTDLCVSGARWFAAKRADGRQEQAVAFVRALMAVPIARIAVENPVGVLSTLIRKPDQIIQPWLYGHDETKATCLWLRGLPLLRATQIVAGRVPRVWRMSPSRDRARLRAVSYSGVAAAMAEQWGAL
jgi:site-specific DNA-cytosine methylase